MKTDSKILNLLIRKSNGITRGRLRPEGTTTTTTTTMLDVPFVLYSLLMPDCFVEI
jgi:hypothetical protein